MGYETKYLGTKAENEAKALQDCKDYLGDRYDGTMKALKVLAGEFGGRTTRKYAAIRDCLGLIIGIQGYYPVRAMVREVLK